MEGKLAQSRSTMNLTYDDPDHGTTVASSVKLGALMGNDTRAEVRQSAWKGLRSIEQHVLSHGFLDIVRARNRLGRMLGGEDYYDFKVCEVWKIEILRIICTDIYMSFFLSFFFFFSSEMMLLIVPVN